MGKAERQVIEACQKRGHPLPESMRDAPMLYFGLADYYSAFWKLSTDRPVGMAVGQIPWSSIDRYAQRERMGDDEYQRFEYLIRAMDDAYMEHANKPKEA